MAFVDIGEDSTRTLKKSKPPPVPQYDSFSSMEMAAISLASLKSSVATMGPFTAFLHNPLSSALSDHFPSQDMQFFSNESSLVVGSSSLSTLVQDNSFVLSRLSQTSTLGPYQASRNVSSSFGSTSSMSFGARTIIASQAMNPALSCRFYRALRGNRSSTKASQVDGDDMEVQYS